MKLYKIFLLFFLFFSSLFGNVKLSISSNNIVKNEPFIFVFEADGNSVKFPDITSLDSYNVQELSSSTSTNIINGKISKSVKKAYSLIATKDFVLPSFEFEIDGKKEYTKEEKINIIEASKTQSEAFDFSIKTNMNDLYVGENFILTLVFKYKKNARLENLYLEKPNFQNFWYKQLDESKNYEEDDFIVSEVNFLMFALKEGDLKIEPIKINVQILENNSYSIFSSSKNEKIYSNSLDFNIKALPQNIKLIGDFEIEAFVDKQKIKVGEAVSYKIKIAGTGNIDEIEDIKFPLENLTIYENKPIIKSEIVNNKSRGEYEKVFSVVPDKSFVIPSITLEYFDKNLKKVIKKQTKSFDIEVINEVSKQEVLLEKAPEKQQQVIQSEQDTKEIIKFVEKTSTIDRIIFFSLGIIVCLLTVALYFYVITSRRKKEEEKKPLLLKIRKAKTKEELIKILAIYIKIDSKLDELIFNLEKTNEINSLKKEIIKIVKELKL